MNNQIKKLVTHNGSFHTDDVFAAAALSIMLGKEGVQYEVIRTRDEEILASGDYVFDVGGVHDPEKNRFDHHQPGGAGKREHGIDYSSFGLVWKKFGADLSGSQKTSDIVDKKLVSAIDAWDNGIDLVENKNETSPYYLQHIISSMRPTWREEDKSDDEVFLEAIKLAKEILGREIAQTRDALFAEEAVLSAYKNAVDKRIIVLDKNYPCEYILNSFPEPLFVIYPRKLNNWWGAKAVRKDPKTFNNRKDFPTAWAGLRDQDLVAATGVPEAIFCHRALYMAVASTKEGAIKLAQLAIES